MLERVHEDDLGLKAGINQPTKPPAPANCASMMVPLVVEHIYADDVWLDLDLMWRLLWAAIDLGICIEILSTAEMMVRKYVNMMAVII